MESNSSRNEELRLLAQRFLESLRQDEEGQALLKQLQLSTSTDASIDQALRNRLQTNFSTEISGGAVDNLVNITKANVVQFLSPKPEPEKLEPQNIPPSDKEFKGRKLEIQSLYNQLNQSGRVVVYSEQNSPGKTELVKRYAKITWEKQIYPGGVCWLQGKETNLAWEIVNFANSKLGLQPPKDTDLQSQIDYCWLHWLEGDVLIVLDDVIDYQQVKSYLPPHSEQRFKLLVTIPQPSVDQLFLDEGFESLLLSLTSDQFEENSDNESDEYHFSYILLTVVIFFVVCSGVSLCLSYIQYGSKPWIESYTDHGWVIEFIRSLIIFIAEINIVFMNFWKGFNELFGWQKTERQYIKYRNFIRIIMLTSAVATIIVLPYYHLEYAPQKLAEFWKEWTSKNPGERYIELEGAEGFAAYNLPYLCYLPYSLINYIIVWLPIAFVTIYAATKDSISLNTYQIKLGRERQKIAFLQKNEYFLVDREGICKDVIDDFTKFSRIFSDKIGDYSIVFLWINIGIAFEVAFGNQTLADTAIFWLILGYVVWAVALIIILLSYRNYEKTLQKSSNILFEIGYENIDDFETDYSSIIFFKKTLSRNVNLQLGLVVLIIILILSFRN